MKTLYFDRQLWVDEHNHLLDHTEFVDEFDNPVPAPTEYHDMVWDKLETLGYNPNGLGDVQLVYFLGEYDYEIETHINHSELPKLITAWLYTGPSDSQLVIYAEEFTARIDLPSKHMSDVEIR